jgi:hypothetical protein
MPSWYWLLAWGCAKANRCSPYTVYAGGEEQGRWVDRRAVTFAGRPSDAAAARYMLDLLAREVDRLAVAFVAKHGKLAARSAGKSFRLGCARKISERLKAQIRETPERIRGELKAAGDAQGLARLDNALAMRQADGQRLEGFLRANGIVYRSGAPLSVSNADAYHAGQRAGAKVQIGGGHALGPGTRALKAGAA